MNAGFYKRRRGILDHLASGKISLLDSAIHDFLCLIADYRTGLAWASAQKIFALCPKAISLKNVQRSLKHLDQMGWIKRFDYNRTRGNYPILIARFAVSRVARPVTQTVTQLNETLSPIEMRVNAERTTDWRDIQYDSVTQPNDLVSPTSGETCPTPVTSSRSKNQEGEKEEEKRERPLGPPAQLPVRATKKMNRRHVSQAVLDAEAQKESIDRDRVEYAIENKNPEERKAEDDRRFYELLEADPYGSTHHQAVRDALEKPYGWNWKFGIPKSVFLQALIRSGRSHWSSAFSFLMHDAFMLCQRNGCDFPSAVEKLCVEKREKHRVQEHRRLALRKSNARGKSS